MANEVTYASLISAGGRISPVLSDLLHVLLYDPTGLRALMVLTPPPNGTGAAGQNITKLTRGTVAAAASSETVGGGSNSVLTTTNFTITVARYYAKMQASSLMQMTGGPIDLGTILSILMETLELTLTNLLCALFQNIAGSVGTSGADLSVDDIFSAMFYLNLQNNPSDLVCVLHPQQINDLQSSLRGETGPMQYRTDAQDLLRPVGVGFRGQFMGIQFYQSDSVETADAGANRAGCMFTMGAFRYCLGAPALDMMVNPADVIAATPEMWVERSRDADNDLSTFFVNFFPGTAEQEDLRAVRVKTDA